MLRALCSKRILAVPVLYALCPLLILFFSPGRATAQGLLQGINALLEFNYTFFSSKTTVSGSTTKIATNTYDPRFTLSVSTNIFPNLRLDAGGVVEENISKSSSNTAETTRTAVTTLTPYFYLTLSDPLYTASIGYNRREVSTETTGQPRFTLFNDDYLAVLKWRPWGFPSIEAQFERTNTYDEEKEVQNTTKDYISLISRYNYRGLDIRYQGTYTDTNDKVNQVDTKDMTQSAWLSYSNSFFDRRVSLSTSYNINYQEIQTSTTAQSTGGTVSLQLFPLAGLSVNNDTVTPTITLGPNPALIDGDLGTSAGINIGLPPLGGDTRIRQMGLDFFVATEVNQLLLWINLDLSTAPVILTFFFSNIQVFSSPDNVNWSPVPLALTPVTFGPFQNRFVINFTNVTTRFIKVVTPPLNAAILGAASFPNIFVTELQAFLTKPVSSVSGVTKNTVTSTTQNYYLDIKTKILDIPTLFYDLDYYYTRIDPSGQLRYIVSNGLSVNQRLSQVFTASGRAAIEDGEEEKEHRVAYVYDAVVQATPLRTLTDRLVFSGRDETIGGKHDSTNSIILYNIAELYKGLEVNLNVGKNFSNNLTPGVKANETDVELLARVIPHPAMTMSLDYKYSIVDQSGGTTPGSTATQRGEFTLSYNPFRTLFIVTTIDLLAVTGQRTLVTQNYGLNWSPFPDGALQFRFFYNEILTTGGIEQRVINPGVRWNITKRSFLDLSYQRIKNVVPGQKTDENFFNAQLKLFLL